MKLHTGNLGTRLGGTALGVGFLAIGTFAVSVSGKAPDAAVGDRAFWLGATFAFAGVCAVAVSWLVDDLSNIWCSQPRRIFRSK
jgi:hypothetical protein